MHRPHARSVQIAPLALAPLALAALLMACGEESAPVEDAPLTSVVGAVAAGAVYSLTIEDATPDPPIRGDVNAWTFALTRDGEPMDGCTFEIEPTMPLHGHGTTPNPDATALGEGRYDMRPINFIMPGEWHVAIRPTCDTVGDEIVLIVDIES